MRLVGKFLGNGQLIFLLLKSSITTEAAWKKTKTRRNQVERINKAEGAVA